MTLYPDSRVDYNPLTGQVYVSKRNQLSIVTTKPINEMATIEHIQIAVPPGKSVVEIMAQSDETMTLLLDDQ